MKESRILNLQEIINKVGNNGQIVFQYNAIKNDIAVPWINWLLNKNTNMHNTQTDTWINNLLTYNVPKKNT